MRRTLGRNKKNQRERSPLSRRLEKALSAYTLAGSAALASMCATPAQAAVHYTLVKVGGGIYTNVGIDLNQDGIVDFILYNFGSPGIDSWNDRLFAVPSGQNGVAYNNGFSAQAFYFGQVIGPKLSFARANNPPTLAITETHFGFFSSHGEFLNQKNRFMGLQFTVNGQVYYGWARLDVKRTHCRPN